MYSSRTVFKTIEAIKNWRQYVVSITHPDHKDKYISELKGYGIPANVSPEKYIISGAYEIVRTRKNKIKRGRPEKQIGEGLIIRLPDGAKPTEDEMDQIGRGILDKLGCAGVYVWHIDKYNGSADCHLIANPPQYE